MQKGFKFPIVILEKIGIGMNLAKFMWTWKRINILSNIDLHICR